MKFLAITLTAAGLLIASGCRHDYNPTPPPYYCQPACGCAPACTPSCILRTQRNDVPDADAGHHSPARPLIAACRQAPMLHPASIIPMPLRAVVPTERRAITPTDRPGCSNTRPNPVPPCEQRSLPGEL